MDAHIMYFCNVNDLHVIIHKPLSIYVMPTTVEVGSISGCLSRGSSMISVSSRLLKSIVAEIMFGAILVPFDQHILEFH